VELGDLRGLATVLCMIGFLGVSWWAYSGRRREQFREASMLPFADEDPPDRTTEELP
jgi:cytochrome c oxidase cbb3-type subunit 4